MIKIYLLTYFSPAVWKLFSCLMSATTAIAFRVLANYSHEYNCTELCSELLRLV